MVAMLIISMSVILSLQAAGHAEIAARQANELQQVNTMLAVLMDDGPRSLAGAAGSDRGFDWALEDRPTGAERPIELCRRAVRLHGRASTRDFTASTIETCPAAGA